MERTEIIKALECCAGVTKAECEHCPYEGRMPSLKETVALIKELQAHNENLKKENKYLRESLADEREHKEDMVYGHSAKSLAEKCEMLSATCNELTQECKKWQSRIPIECDYTKAITIKKMQDELKKTFSALCKGEMGDLYRIIDQIAKELLEGEQ